MVPCTIPSPCHYEPGSFTPKLHDILLDTSKNISCLEMPPLQVDRRTKEVGKPPTGMSFSFAFLDAVCPTGHSCPPGSLEPRPCPPGQYQDEPGRSTCKICPAGK